VAAADDFIVQDKIDGLPFNQKRVRMPPVKAATV
jgi:hypothetical protein